MRSGRFRTGEVLSGPPWALPDDSAIFVDRPHAMQRNRSQDTVLVFHREGSRLRGIERRRLKANNLFPSRDAVPVAEREHTSAELRIPFDAVDQV